MPDRDSKIVIGLIGMSDAAISVGKRGYCYFPIGKEDPTYRGGRVWKRVKVTAIDDIHANSDVVVVDNQKNVREQALESPLINEKTILNNSDNIVAGATENTGSVETAGYNKITGFIYADQDLTVYIDQSHDGQNWDVVTTVNYVAEATNGGFNEKIVASYTRVRFYNGSSPATTECRKMVRLSAGA